MSISCSCTSQIKSVGQPNHRQLLALILSWPARAWVANKKWAGLLPNEKYSEKAVCQRHGSANVKTFLLLPNEKYSVAATDSAVPKKRTILVFSSCFPVAHWLPFLGNSHDVFGKVLYLGPHAAFPNGWFVITFHVECQSGFTTFQYTWESWHFFMWLQ